MKYLLVLIVVAIAIGVWRSQRRAQVREQHRRAAPPAPLSAPQDMVECAHCGLHLPRSEALQAEGRCYCSAEHRALAQRR